ncbi:hypothetical protein [Desnuesiella massiliensis]|uniref:hypothetical protein n=1 Tax=Desnuesiella massiliensis TaxID=1650662 RepID=UPI0006E44A2D|nr:hypothetical protein [Desnuesiella massiliensis]
MLIKEYLLDANIVIRIWDTYPKLFDSMEKTKEVDFKITRNIAIEVSKKEFKDYNGVPVLSNRFLKLLEHIVDDIEINLEEKTNNSSIKYDSIKNLYYINENKISANDYNLICFCKSNDKYLLVTEDKFLLQSARIVIESSRILSFKEFIEQLEKLNIPY